MITSFADQGTEDIYNGDNSKAARATLPKELWKKAQLKMTWINAATTLQDLARPPGNSLEALKDDRAGQHSIRINDQYRICFKFEGGNASDVEIVDYH